MPAGEREVDEEGSWVDQVGQWVGELLGVLPHQSSKRRRRAERRRKRAAAAVAEEASDAKGGVPEDGSASGSRAAATEGEATPASARTRPSAAAPLSKGKSVWERLQRRLGEKDSEEPEEQGRPGSGSSIPHAGDGAQFPAQQHRPPLIDLLALWREHVPTPGSSDHGDPPDSPAPKASPKRSSPERLRNARPRPPPPPLPESPRSAMWRMRHHQAREGRDQPWRKPWRVPPASGAGMDTSPPGIPDMPVLGAGDDAGEGGYGGAAEATLAGGQQVSPRRQSPTLWSFSSAMSVEERSSILQASSIGASVRPHFGLEPVMSPQGSPRRSPRSPPHSARPRSPSPMSPRLSRLSALPGDEALARATPGVCAGQGAVPGDPRRSAAERLRQLSAAQSRASRMHAASGAQRLALTQQAREGADCEAASSGGPSTSNGGAAGSATAGRVPDAAPPRHAPVPPPNGVWQVDRRARSPVLTQQDAMPPPPTVQDPTEQDAYWKDLESLLRSDVLKLRVIDIFRELVRDSHSHTPARPCAAVTPCGAALNTIRSVSALCVYACACRATPCPSMQMLEEGIEQGRRSWRDARDETHDRVRAPRVCVQDKNSDGMVTLNEFRQRMTSLGASHLAEEVANLFAVIDVNGDRVIRYTELDKWVRGGRLRLATELRAKAAANLPYSSPSGTSAPRLRVAGKVAVRRSEMR